MNEDLRRAYAQFKVGGGVADLSARVKLMLTGADRVRYLNGQVTSNVTRLIAGQTQSACVTTAKGRLCAEVVISGGAGTLRVDADPLVEGVLAARLERYIVADEVVLTEMRGTGLFHFLGMDPRPFLAPEAALNRANRFGIEGWDFWPESEEAREACLRMPRVAVLEEPLLETVRIEHGVPRWGSELGEETLPPEAGLDRTHIDYHKGCYIGQEVISRLKSVGHVNRELVGFICSAGTALKPGMEVFSGDLPKPVGRITSATWSFALEKPIALGYLKRGIAGASLVAGAPGNAIPVEVRSLPFHS